MNNLNRMKLFVNQPALGLLPSTSPEPLLEWPATTFVLRCSSSLSFAFEGVKTTGMTRSFKPA